MADLIQFGTEVIGDSGRTSLMARTKKDNVLIIVQLEKGIFEKLSKFCEDSG